MASWLKQPGDHVEKGEAIVELETDKVNIEVPSDEAGTLTEVMAAEGDTVRVGETIAVISAGGEAPKPAAAETVQETPKETPKAEEKAEQPVAAAATESTSVADRPIASPAARKLAREKGIDLAQVATQDPLGRIRVQDVATFEVAPREQAKPAPTKPATPAPAPAAAPGKPEERIKMSRRRKTIANRLVEVQQTAAMLTTFNEIDMSAVMALRKRRQEKFVKENEVKLGFMSFFTKAAVAALKKMPYLNAEIQGDEIVLKKFYDIGIAVSAPDGRCSSRS